METYVDAEGNLKEEFFKTTKWGVFVSFLLTQVDCACFALSWYIAVGLAIWRAILFFVIDLYRKDRHPAPKEAVTFSSSKDLKPDDDTSPSDGKPMSSSGLAEDHGKVLMKRDSGLSLSSSLDASDSGSPVHQDAAMNVTGQKVILQDVTENK